MRRELALTLAAALMSPAAMASGTHSGGGGGGGGHSGGGHSGGSSGHSSPSHGGGQSSARSSSSGHIRDHSTGFHSYGSGLSGAERRHPSGGGGRLRPYRPYGGSYYGSYYSPGFYGSLYFGWPYFYDPFYYDPFFYGGYGAYGGGYALGYYPPYPPAGYPGEDPAPYAPRDPEADRGRYGDRSTDSAPEDPDSAQVRISAWPLDASIYVDGEFRGTAREVTVLRLPAGRHRIEVVRPGFRPVEREVEVGAGETRELRLRLQRP